MRKLMSVIVVLLTIAFEGFSQTKPDTVCIPREDALRKLRQADSLVIAKNQIAEQKFNINILNNRVYEKDTTIAGLKGKISVKDELISSKDREIKNVNDKFKLADDQVKSFNKKLKRANTRTVFGTIIGAAIPVIITLISKNK